MLSLFSVFIILKLGSRMGVAWAVCRTELGSDLHE